MPTRIIREICNNCGICVFQCGGFVYEFVDEEQQEVVKVARPKDCVDCFICVERCPRGAIKLFFKGEKYVLGFE